MSVLDRPSRMATLDAEGMLGILDRFGSDCAAAIRCADSVAPLPMSTPVDQIVACGMGGSAMGGEILRRFSRSPTEVHRSGRLPSQTSDRTLLVAISYSGNTTETLSALEQALETQARFLCVSSGGRLAELARERGLPLVVVPSGYPPRAALPYLGLGPLAVLGRSGLVSMPERWEEVFQGIAEDGRRLGADVPTKDNSAKQIAIALNGRVPVVIGVAGTTDLAALRWKTQINENAKQPAFCSVIPELLHNEILAWDEERSRRHLCAVVLRSQDDTEADASRAAYVSRLLREKRVPVIEVDAPGTSPHERVLRLLYLGDFVSVYLALSRRVDPTPVLGIDAMKRSLGYVGRETPDVP
ncbi:MAG: bifunctional phosphoglucose/phosphomannose isomerase [Candidatus Bipolaricaulis sp.]|nr:bifunctional phosphoglucose/phosphomannose isomerase [Candidatus Bipolaricaulis sp.]